MTLKHFTYAALTLPLLMLVACTATSDKDESTSVMAEAISAPADAPNVIFILVDDMGYGQLGVTGQVQYAHPHAFHS